MEKEKINVKCPKCERVLTILKPAKPGMYQLTCNNCSHQFKLQLRGVPIQTEETPKASGNTSQNQRKVKVLGMPKLHKDGKYHIDEAALINHPYGCVCPCCQKALVFLPRQEGVMAVKCDKCSTSVIFKAVPANSKPENLPVKKETSADSNKSEMVTSPDKESVVTQPCRLKGNKTLGMLSWGNIFRRKKFVLYEGKTIIGRQDQDEPSDIEIKDKNISRRSAEIDVTKGDGGFFFKFTVIKATNPVYLNYKELNVGESVFLKYGDVIQLGETLINFSQVK